MARLGALTILGASILFLACSGPSPVQPQLASPGHPDKPNVLAGRLTPELFINRRFVAYTDLWGIWLPDGDPIRFSPDGTVENEKAGLRGKWKVLDDATVLIADRRFSYSTAKRCLFSPLTPGADVGWYILLEEDKQQWRDDRFKFK
jgi:hypothetical protein